uniref:Uncharacterized protein n=1 Tax=Rhizophora mucronata TaxID=61149 RepID=A0A2P2QC51_RHIMU
MKQHFLDDTYSSCHLPTVKISIHFIYALWLPEIKFHFLLLYASF